MIANNPPIKYINVFYKLAYNKIFLPPDTETLKSLLFSAFSITESQVEDIYFINDLSIVIPVDVANLSVNAKYHLKVFFKPNYVKDQANFKEEFDNNIVIACSNHSSINDDELSFKRGDLINVIKKHNQDWWYGRLQNGSEGYFPTSLVRSKRPDKLLGENQVVDHQNSSLNYQDDEYFEGYANLTIHWEMLHDSSRTIAYKNGILNSSNFIKDKLVLDVGTGSGILAIFCTKAGAKHIYGIDASNIIQDTYNVIKDNDLIDKISLIQGKVEDGLIPCSEVDVIVSEWMGTMLLCESMLISVIIARDKYLSKNGIMIPSKARLLLSAIDCSDYYNDKINFWSNVYDVNMASLKQKAIETYFSRAIFSRQIPKKELISNTAVILDLDMKTVKESDLEFIIKAFSITINKNGKLNGFGSWFDVSFIGNIILSTSPNDPETHWKNVMFPFESILDVVIGDVIKGVMIVKRNKYWRRHYEVTIQFSIEGKEGKYQKDFELW